MRNARKARRDRTSNLASCPDPQPVKKKNNEKKKKTKPGSAKHYESSAASADCSDQVVPQILTDVESSEVEASEVPEEDGLAKADSLRPDGDASEPGKVDAGESDGSSFGAARGSAADPESEDPRMICWLCHAPQQTVQLRKCQGCLKVRPLTNGQV